MNSWVELERKSYEYCIRNLGTNHDDGYDDLWDQGVWSLCLFGFWYWQELMSTCTQSLVPERDEAVYQHEPNTSNQLPLFTVCSLGIQGLCFSKSYIYTCGMAAEADGAWPLTRKLHAS